MFGSKKSTDECYINEWTFECSNIYSCPSVHMHIITSYKYSEHIPVYHMCNGQAI